MKSPRRIFTHSELIPQPPKIPLNLSFQPVTLSKLLPQLASQPRHLLCKRLPIVFLLLSTHVTPRCQHKIMLLDLLQAGGFTEAGDILIALATLPSMKSIGDLGDVVVGEVPQYPVPHEAQVTGIDKQELLPAVALFLAAHHAVG